MSDSEFSGGEFREGFGADDLADFGGGGDFGGDFGFNDFPQDNFSQGLVGAGDLSTGMPAPNGQDPYGNVGVQQSQSAGDKVLEFYAEEAKNGLSAFGKLFTETLKILGQLPIGSLGGLWAGWLLLGVINLPVGAIGFLVTQHIINRGGTGAVLSWQTGFGALFASGGLFLLSGAIFGFVMTTKLKRGDKTLSGVELEVTAQDEAEDTGEEFGSAEECFSDIGYSDDDEVYSAEDPMGANPYDDILAMPEEEPEPELVDNSKKVVVQNQAPDVINRSLDNINDLTAVGNLKETIFKLALDILPCYQPNFTDIKDIEQGSDQWNTLEHFILSAIKTVTGTKDDGDITTRIKEIKKSSTSYNIVATRYAKMKTESQLADFDKELKNFLDEEMGDSTSVTIGDKQEIACSTVAKGTNYYISIIIPSKKLVSLGDVYHSEDFQKFKNTKKMPICLGLDNAGRMLLYDAKPDNGVMLCGQTRSGKSWFTMYYLLNFMIQQSPLQHQFILIDPKDTGLFAAMSLMPHVMGLHCPPQDDPQSPRVILKILEEFIYTEGERRKKDFKEKGYENYWDYVAGEGEESLPMITLVMDEYMSIDGMFKETKSRLGEDLRPQFVTYINNLISKLPAYGLRLIIIPHRVPGMVEPMTRDLMKFKASFRSNENLTTSNFGLNKVGIPLPNAGDMAWMSEMQTTPIYTHTLCVGADDNLMKNTIVLLAKAYYKLGVDMPDMSDMVHCFTRNDEEIVNTIQNWDFAHGRKAIAKK